MLSNIAFPTRRFMNVFWGNSTAESPRRVAAMTKIFLEFEICRARRISVILAAETWMQAARERDDALRAVVAA